MTFFGLRWWIWLIILGAITIVVLLVVYVGLPLFKKWAADQANKHLSPHLEKLKNKIQDLKDKLNNIPDLKIKIPDFEHFLTWVGTDFTLEGNDFPNQQQIDKYISDYKNKSPE